MCFSRASSFPIVSPSIASGGAAVHISPTSPSAPQRSVLTVLILTPASPGLPHAICFLLSVCLVSEHVNEFTLWLTQAPGRVLKIRPAEADSWGALDAAGLTQTLLQCSISQTTIWAAWLFVSQRFRNLSFSKKKKMKKGYNTMWCIYCENVVSQNLLNSEIKSLFVSSNNKKKLQRRFQRLKQLRAATNTTNANMHSVNSVCKEFSVKRRYDAKKKENKGTSGKMMDS